MSSSKILALRSLLPPVRPTLGTHSLAYHIAESRHVTDMAAVFTVCLCTANSGQRQLLYLGWSRVALIGATMGAKVAGAAADPD